MYVIEAQHQGSPVSTNTKTVASNIRRALSVVHGVIYSVVVLPGLCP